MPVDVGDGDTSHSESNQGQEERWEQVRGRVQDAVRRANQQGRRRSPGLLGKRATIIGAGLVGAVVLCLVVYLVWPGPASQSTSQGKAAQPGASSGTGQVASQSAASQPASPAAGPANSAAQALLTPPTSNLQTERWASRLARIGLSLALAALLGALLAFRPRRDPAAAGRTQEAAGTQILISMLAAGLMLVAVGDVAIALAIVGAAILIRVRPWTSEPREPTVLLVSAGVGLACGAGRWEVAIILGGFAFAVLWVIESSEPEETTRSVDLSVETRSVRETNEVLREVFDKNHVAAEFVRVDSSDPTGRTGMVHYSISVKQAISLDRLSQEIFSEDPDNVLSVNWQQRRWPAVAYR